jgi:hypothetical protein
MHFPRFKDVTQLCSLTLPYCFRVLMYTHSLVPLPIHSLVILSTVSHRLAPTAPFDLFPRSTYRAIRACNLRLVPCPSLKHLPLDGLPCLDFAFDLPTHATDDDRYVGIARFVKIGHWCLQNSCDGRSAIDAKRMRRRATSGSVPFHERQYRMPETVMKG